MTSKQGFKEVLREESNKKRLESLRARQDQSRDQNALIRNALSGQTMAKKIKFNDDEPKLKLFENGDTDDDETFNIPESKVNSKYSSKLVEMQSRFAHDDRFKVDERFVDEEDCEDVNVVSNENKGNMAILNELLGGQTKKVASETFVMPRYDPSKEESKKLLKSDTATKKKEKAVIEFEFPLKELPKDTKKVSFDQTVEEREKSKERYIQVDPSLKDSFASSSGKKDGFSLLKILGADVDTPTDDTGDNDKGSAAENVPEEKVTKRMSKFDPIQVKYRNPNLKYEKFLAPSEEQLDQDEFFKPDLIEKHNNEWSKKVEAIDTGLAALHRMFKKEKEKKEKVWSVSREDFHKAKALKFRKMKNQFHPRVRYSHDKKGRFPRLNPDEPSVIDERKKKKNNSTNKSMN